MVVVKELRGYDAVSPELSVQLRILLHEFVVVPEFGVEKVAALLDVGNARLPVQVEKVAFYDGDITQAVELVLVPEDLVSAGAGLDLLPHHIVVGILKVVLLHDAGHDLGEYVCLGPVLRLSGKQHRLRICVHRVGVLAHDDVMQPAGSAGEAINVADDVGHAALLLLVVQLPPLLSGYNAPLRGSPGTLVAL